MKILITGVAGFIGSHLADRFLGKGFTVHGQDNLLTGRMSNIEHILDDREFHFTEENVAKKVVDKKFDFILHFASPASPNPSSKYGYPNLPLQTIMSNVWGTYNCLELAHKTGAGFMMASTSEIYGDPDTCPQEETYNGNVNPIGLRSPYDESKRMAEALTMMYHRKYNVNTRIVRIFNTYGPRMRPDDGRAIPNFINQALSNKPITIYGDGEQTRSFCYIDDLVRGIDLLMRSKYHVPVNIGNPTETKIIDLANMIRDRAGIDCEIKIMPKARFGKDPERRCPDITRAKDGLGWEPVVELEDGLEKTIDYYIKKR